MDDSLDIELFCEDLGHEIFCRALLRRLGTESGRKISINVRSAHGGKGRALSEFRAWQRAATSIRSGRPDLLVIVIDANCHGWNEARTEIEKAIDPSVYPAYVVGCPDPHVERWCLADPQAFMRAIGTIPSNDPGKCEKGLYKTLLRKSIQTAGHIILSDPMDFAPEFVQEMSFYSAGKRQPSLGRFIDSLRSVFKRV